MSRVRDKRTTAFLMLRLRRWWEQQATVPRYKGLSYGVQMGKPANSGKAWTSGQEAQLRQMARGNTPTRVAGLKLGRSPGAVQNKAHELGISLKPTNQSPYNRTKK